MGGANVHSLEGDPGSTVMNQAAKSRLESELRLFEETKKSWLRSHKNEYVVIKGNRTLGFYQSFSAAYYAGAQEFGSGTEFLVKKVVETEAVFVNY